MPVIVREQHHAAWLGETEDGNLKELLVPYPADQMRMWEISPTGKQPEEKTIHRSGNFSDAKPTQRKTDALELLPE
jgi:putative SOS response-associated peptidase YedK